MPKAKGVPAEQKRLNVQKKVMDSGDFFSSKEMEKICASCGIGGMQFKAELNTIMGDDLLRSDKIGLSHYYWKLKSEAAKEQEKRSKDCQSQLESLKGRKKHLEEAIAKQKKRKADESGREELLQRYYSLEKECKEKRNAVSAFSDSDPEALEKMKKAKSTGYEAAVRWTHNVWALESYMMKKCVGQEKELKGHFKSCGYTDDFDYPSAPAN